MGWYPFFLFTLLLFSTPIYGQSSESSQKQAKVIEQRQQSKPQHNPNNNYNSRPLPPRVYTPYYYNPMVWGYTPYWNINRRWDNRTYIITTDETRIQSQQPPLRFSFGVLSEVTTQQPNTFSPYLTIGGESFLLLQYHLSIPSSYPYYDNIYPWEVQQWEDEYIGTSLDRREFVVGFGKSVKRFSPFIGLGIGTITSYDTYRDELWLLSGPQYDGYYLINKTKQTQLSAKVGTMYGWEWIEGLVQLSLGEEIRFGLGIGIKL